MARRKAFRFYGDFPDLMAVPEAIRHAVMPAIVKAGVELAKQEAPKGRGASNKKSIVMRIAGATEKQDAVGHIRARAPHSHLIEFGTRAHSLASGSGRSKKRAGKRMTINGDPNIIRSGAWHPGSRANPFMERTEQGLPSIIDLELVNAGTKALKDCLKPAEKLLGNLS